MMNLIRFQHPFTIDTALLPATVLDKLQRQTAAPASQLRGRLDATPLPEGRGYTFHIVTRHMTPYGKKTMHIRGRIQRTGTTTRISGYIGFVWRLPLLLIALAALYVLLIGGGLSLLLATLTLTASAIMLTNWLMLRIRAADLAEALDDAVIQRERETLHRLSQQPNLTNLPRYVRYTEHDLWDARDELRHQRR